MCLGGGGGGGRLEAVGGLLMDLELVDLALKRVEVDLVESPLSRSAGCQGEGGLWVGRDGDVPAALLLGRRVGCGGERRGVEGGRSELLDGKLYARRRGGGRSLCRS